MKYGKIKEYPYINSKDYAIWPTGEVIFLNKDLPEDIKKRLIEDVKRDWEERLHPSPDKPLLDWES